MSRSQVRFLFFIVAVAVIVLVAIWVKNWYGQVRVRTEGGSQELSRNDGGSLKTPASPGALECDPGWFGHGNPSQWSEKDPAP